MGGVWGCEWCVGGWSVGLSGGWVECGAVSGVWVGGVWGCEWCVGGWSVGL